MRTKTRLLLPAGVLAAALIGVACGPPPPPPPPPPPAACPAVPASAAGPDSQNPIPGTWGVNGIARASVVIGNRVYVGGDFTAAVAPTGAQTARNKLAAFCLANGRLDTSFVPNLGATTVNRVNALATDGTNLFVGGEFFAGASPLHLVKVSAVSGARIAAFAPKAPQQPVLDMHYANGVLYAGGEFGKIGPQGPTSDYVGNAAGFNATTGAWTGWFAGASSKVESITVSPDNTAVYIGGNFTEVKKPDQATPGNNRDRLARLTTAAPGNLVAAFDAGVLGARPYDLAVSANNASLYAAIGTGPGAAGAGNRIINFNTANGTQAWNNDNLQGNGEAVEVIGANLYAGFLGGYDGGLLLNPNNYRLLGINPANANINAQVLPNFQPSVVATNGVYDLAQGSNRMVAVGDFTAIGTTTNLRGLAIFG
jgi:hypothetical protein